MRTPLKPVQAMLLRGLCACALLAGAAACGTVSVHSEPRDAEVVVIGPGQEKGKPLGKTPYAGNLRDLVDLAGDGPVVLQIRKEGFAPQNIFVPNLSGAKLEFSASLTPLTSAHAYLDINKVVQLTLRAERMILQNQLDEALATASAIRKINDNIASAYSIEGAVYMVKGDLKRSRTAWKKSLEIEPDNADSAGMVRIVEEKLGKKAGS